MKRNSVAKNTIWIVASKIVQSVLGLIISMMSARFLGPSNFGLISYAASVVAFVAPIMKLGFNHVIVQEVINKPEKDNETLGSAMFFSALTSIACIAGVFTFSYFANPGETDTHIVCLLYSVSLFFQATEMIQYWYQAKLLSQYTSITALIAYIVVSLYKIFLLISKKNVCWFAISNSIDYFIISIVLIIFYFRLTHLKLKVSFKCALQMFNRSKYFIVSSMMITIFAQTDKIMLKMILGEESVGIYSAAISCAGMTSFLFGAIIESFTPVILESKKNNQKSYETNVIRLYSIIIYVAIIQSIFLFFCSGIVIYILYGVEYAASESVLRIITWYSTFSYMGSVRNVWILAEEKQKYLWIINLSGAVLNIICNFFLINTLGAEGAALASVATQFFTNFVLCIIMKPIRPCVRLIIKSLNPKYIFEIIRKKKLSN